MAGDLTVPPEQKPSTWSTRLPAVICRAGEAAAHAWKDFFDARIGNPATRRAYSTAVRQFLAWADLRGLGLSRIMPAEVGIYFREHRGSPSTKKQHLAALRRFFNLLVERHICLINPAAVAELEKYRVKKGKTEEITAAEIERLMASLDTSHVVGLRDRAVLGILMYTGARIGALAKLRRADYHGRPGNMQLRFLEKGGNCQDVEVRHNLEQFIDDYLVAARMKTTNSDCPLFRAAAGKQKRLLRWTPPGENRPERGRMTQNDMCRLVKRRLRAAGLRPDLSAHSFRVAVATNLIGQGVPVEDVQELLGHADARTTKLYDRTHRRATRNLVERISFLTEHG